ncbi:MAG: hypothetical protein ACOC1O_05145 [bacterium]
MLKVKKEWVSNIPMPVKYARLSHDSIDKSDSTEDKLGEADLRLAKKLCKAGSSHRKFMRQIHVLALVEAPWKWWKEYATYKIGTTENSSSMMHTLIDHELTEDDFCFERMTLARQKMIDNANNVLKRYKEAPKESRYHIWEELNDIIGGGYKYKRIIDVSYEQLANMYFQRKVHPHKMREWHQFARWMETLPYFELIKVSATKGD